MKSRKQVSQKLRQRQENPSVNSTRCVRNWLFVKPFDFFAADTGGSIKKPQKTQIPFCYLAEGQISEAQVLVHSSKGGEMGYSKEEQ